MNNEPLVTVGITTFNRCDLLKKALDSVVNQTYKNLEIIIGDNHSEDSTENLCNEYANNDKRIKYLRHSENIGMYNNARFILDKALGRHLIFLCDDDWLSENFIEEAVKKMESVPNSVAVGSIVHLYDETGNFIKECTSVSFDANNYTTRAKLVAENFMELKLVLLLVEMTAYKEIIKGTEARFCEDQLMAVRAALLGKIHILNNAIYHKIHNGCTKDLETLVKIFDLEGFTPENYPYKLAQCHKDAITNDKFFVDRLDEKKRKKLADTVCKAIIRANTPRCGSDELRGYMWRHPFFLFDSSFYSKLKSYLGIVDIKKEDV